MLLGGFYEPVLASLPRLDRVEQVGWMRQALRARLGAEARGLWLTERVWEPDLASDLHDAGVRFALVDDRHFLVSGFTREQLHAPLQTEHDGKQLTLFSIDERLRYLIPFQPAHDSAAYLRWLRESGHSLAVLADDGEKFGGWPGTADWVYRRGWLDDFIGVMESSMRAGDVVMSRFDEALERVPGGGIAYLATGSYREMEGWSLPPEAALRLGALEKDFGAERLASTDGALLRGGHWRNFLVKYTESNRMHKKMIALSALCRERGDPESARRAIGRAQCNDAYWHGVFGGLYLPFLRAAVWSNLARAERELRTGEAIAWERRDIDFDGHAEIWIHSSEFSAIVSPRRGGALEELTRFADGANVADALTRRREAYHVQARDTVSPGGQKGSARDESGDSNASQDAASTTAPDAFDESDEHVATRAPSIHELEGLLRLEELPPVDQDDRALFVERIIGNDVTFERFVRTNYTPIATTANQPLSHEIAETADEVVVTLRSPDGAWVKRLAFSTSGGVRAEFEWDSGELRDTTWFTTELSCAGETVLRTEPAAEIWSFPIETVAKSERGFDRTVQGVSYVLRWPAALGRATVELPVAAHRESSGKA
jgi:alpha-amylase